MNYIKWVSLCENRVFGVLAVLYCRFDLICHANGIRVLWAYLARWLDSEDHEHGKIHLARLQVMLLWPKHRWFIQLPVVYFMKVPFSSKVFHDIAVERYTMTPFGVDRSLPLAFVTHHEQYGILLIQWFQT